MIHIILLILSICLIYNYIYYNKLNIIYPNSHYTIVHKNSSQSIDDPSIYGIFYNNYKYPLTFNECVFYGAVQIGQIKEILYPFEEQRLIFKALQFDVVDQVTGDCFYYVPISSTINPNQYVILDILFYHNVNGHEYYGMNNSIYYKVDIKIIANGQPRYYLL
jgi:hypothetical protein